jgi:hypothetical protein
MKLRVLIAIAAIPAIATVGYAQTTTPTPTQEPSATTTPAPGATTTTTTAQTTTNAPQWYQHQQNEWRASKLIGSKVKNNADETIDDINKILLTSDGSAAAAVIGVGGFLGLGEREVAVQFKSPQLTRDPSGDVVVKLDTSKDALKNAPVWTWQSS